MTNRLRILFLADGRSIHTKRWVSWFAQHHDVRLLSSPPLDGWEWDRPEVQLARGSADHIIPKINSLRVWAYLKREIADFRPDVLHAHYLTPNAWLAAATGFTPIVATAWGSDLLGVSGVFAALNRWALRRTALCTSDSAEALHQLSLLGVPKAKLHLIQFGVDTDFFSPAPADPQLLASWRLPTNAKIVLSPRILRPLYNIDVIARAFIRIAARQPDAYLVVLTYHSDAVYQAKVQGLLRQAGLLDRCRFLGRLSHDQMPDLYRSASVILSVPSSDTTPVTLLEAMACGAPTIASNLPSIREWITDGQNGWLVTTGDDAGLAAALERGLSLPAEGRRRLMESNRRLAIERAGQEANMKLMEGLYFKLRDRV